MAQVAYGIPCTRYPCPKREMRAFQHVFESPKSCLSENRTDWRETWSCYRIIMQKHAKTMQTYRSRLSCSNGAEICSIVISNPRTLQLCLCIYMSWCSLSASPLRPLHFRKRIVVAVFGDTPFAWGYGLVHQSTIKTSLVLDIQKLPARKVLRAL